MCSHKDCIRAFERRSNVGRPIIHSPSKGLSKNELFDPMGKWAQVI
jgi:hypothetical protein